MGSGIGNEVARLLHSTARARPSGSGRVAQRRGKADAAAKAVADEDVNALIQLLEDEMKRAASNLEFERAAELRDEVTTLKKDAEARGVPLAQN